MAKVGRTATLEKTTPIAHKNVRGSSEITSVGERKAQATATVNNVSGDTNGRTHSITDD